MAPALPERQRTRHEQQGRQEYGDQCQAGACPASGRRLHRRPQKGRKGKQRPGHGLRQPVAGQEHRRIDPAPLHHLAFQQRQHHMPAAEHQTAGAIERRQQLHCLPRPGHHAQGEQHRKQSQPAQCRPAVDRHLECVVTPLAVRTQQQHTQQAGERQHRDHPAARMHPPPQHNDGGRQHERQLRRTAAERPPHAPHSLQDHRNGSQVQAVQQAWRHRAAPVHQPLRGQH